jgi:hypothetical protein
MAKEAGDGTIVGGCSGRNMAERKTTDAGRRNQCSRFVVDDGDKRKDTVGGAADDAVQASYPLSFRSKSLR